MATPSFSAPSMNLQVEAERIRSGTSFTSQRRSTSAYAAS
jgi:hypothetical protein